MVVTSQEIAEMQEKLSALKKQKEEAYERYGARCALVEGTCPLGSCHEEWQEYEEKREAAGRARREYQRLQQRFEQISDTKERVRRGEKDLRKGEKEKRVMASRLGAVAWEAYQRGKIQELCAPFFSKHLSLVKKSDEDIKKGGLSRLRGKVRKKALLKGTYRMFLSCGTFLLEGRKYHETGDEAIIAETDALLARVLQIREDLEEDRKGITNLEGQTDKGRLDEAKSSLEEREKELERAAATYGRMVYEQVPPDAINRIVGQKGVRDAFAILEKQNEIAAVEADITRSRNLMEAEELSAQNDLDFRKIDHLREQRESIDRQIEQIQGTIRERKQKISLLGGLGNG